MAYLNKIFSSNMVFAAGKPIRIYGGGTGKAVVTFAGCRQETAAEDGAWMLEFPPMDHGGPFTLEAELDGERALLDNIYIGEVYLLAGQSNMQFKNADSVTEAGGYRSNEMLRLFSTARVEDQEHFYPEDGWVPCRAGEAAYWSAIAYHMGQAVTAARNVAVGVIVCYQGASVIESWVPSGTFQRIGIHLTEEEKYCDHCMEEFSSWNRDGFLYGYALSQIIPFSLSAVVWYQGESDTSLQEALVYKEELAELIRVWRRAFADAALPFVIIQLADFRERTDEAWALLQKAQQEVQFLMENVTTVRSADLCETDDIHPPTKSRLARRIADVLSGGWSR